MNKVNAKYKRSIVLFYPNTFEYVYKSILHYVDINRSGSIHVSKIINS